MDLVHRKAVTRVIFVRHGQSDFNAEKRLQGSLDEPRLTDKGWETAVACGIHINQFHCDVIFCSSLRRARQTLEGILSTYSLERVVPPVFYDSRLCEVHLPGWEGLSMKSIENSFPLEYRMWRDYPDQLVLQKHEMDGLDEYSNFSPLGDTTERVREFLEDLLLHRCGQTIMIVGHGTAISVMLAVALKLPLADVHRVQQSNGGISCIEFRADGVTHARVCFINRTQHLGEVLPKMKENKTGSRILLLSEESTSSICLIERLRGMSADVIQGVRSAQVISDLLEDQTKTARTVVWAHPTRHMQSDCYKALRLEHWPSHSLTLLDGGLTVLHYPSHGCKPILQALNIDIDKMRYPDS